ncbi:hypothetical protein [Halalkalibacterium halodurans]|uniref:hypothetical protein n=1 Tax=Halalkalibacterium halodurans TaxID=86665 RepID=UPI002AAA2E3F|nr:hypothetical protein [Halalkalibacterium halodurans]MDY7223611.1 hypothetical protein [Halalkalibacterium halodurans]MDY7242832.1 hypothetical protein [Halalkalibacterium halodurans]
MPTGVKALNYRCVLVEDTELEEPKAIVETSKEIATTILSRVPIKKDKHSGLSSLFRKCIGKGYMIIGESK